MDVKVLKINPLYLQNSSKTKKKSTRRKSKKQSQTPYIKSLQDRTPKTRETIQYISKIVDNYKKKKKSSVQIKEEPPYGNLKSGKKPTLSEYRKTLKQKMNVDTKHKYEPTIELPSLKFNKKLDLVPEKPKHNKTYKKNIHHLGKTKHNKIGVLIKNNKSRKLIDEQIQKFNNTPIYEIRKYLKDRNIIKSGSTAPDFILKKIFLDLLCTGDIYNKNGQWLLHNYLNEEEMKPTLEIGNQIDYKIDIELLD